MSHEKYRNRRDEVGREWNTHTWNPRCVGMELKLIVTRWRRRIYPKSKTLASKNQSEALNLLQWPKKSLLGNWIGRTLEELEEMGEKLKRRRVFKSLASTNRSTGPGLVDRLVNAINAVNFSTFVHFLVLWSSSCHFQLKSPNFDAQLPREFWFLATKFIICIRLCLYDANDMKFMQSKGIFIKNSLRNH